MTVPAYPAYRESGVEWLGRVPVGWEVLAIKRLSPVQRGASPRPIDDPKYFDDEGTYAWVRISDVSNCDGRLAETSQRLSDLGSSLSVKLEPGNLFVSIAGSVGKPCISAVRACIHDGFVYFPNLKIKADFLFRIFEAGLCYAGLGKFGTQLNLNTDTIGAIKIALPPEHEIDAILAFLDRETGKIDALVAGQERLIALLKEKRQAVISQAVTKGLDVSAPMKDSGVAWLGQVPAHWAVLRLGALFREAIEEGEHDLPVLSVSIHDGVSDRELSDSEMDRKVTRSEDRTKYKKVAAGDLVYNMMRAWQGGFGTVAVAGMVSPAYVVARPSGDLRTAFVEFVLRTPQAIEEMRRYSKGVTDFRLRLYWDEFKQIVLAVPPLTEQASILAAIDEQAARFDTLTTEAHRAIALLRERRAALISAAVTGKIDVRGLVWSAADDHSMIGRTPATEAHAHAAP